MRNRLGIGTDEGRCGRAAVWTSAFGMTGLMSKLGPDDVDVGQRCPWSNSARGDRRGAESRHLMELIVLMIRGIAPNAHPELA